MFRNQTIKNLPKLLLAIFFAVIFLGLGYYQIDTYKESKFILFTVIFEKIRRKIILKFLK
jgi:hypothetical protein